MLELVLLFTKTGCRLLLADGVDRLTQVLLYLGCIRLCAMGPHIPVIISHCAAVIVYGIAWPGRTVLQQTYFLTSPVLRLLMGPCADGHYLAVGKLMDANHGAAEDGGQKYTDTSARSDKIMWLHVGQPPADTPAFSSLMVSFQELQVCTHSTWLALRGNSCLSGRQGCPMADRAVQRRTGLPSGRQGCPRGRQYCVCGR